jgi:alpha-tubulin suppressor-like RCC1 family protein
LNQSFEEKSVARQLWVVVACLITSCTSVTNYTCTDNSNCVDDHGAQGVCDTTGVCSFVDATCAESHLRLVGVLPGAKGDCVLAAKSCVADFTVGHDVICALRTDHSLYCWGDNTTSQLANDGLGVSESTPQLITIPSPAFVTQVSAADGFECALLSDTSVWCWGKNNAKQLGIDSDQVSSQVPVQTLRLGSDGGTDGPLTGIKKISAGGLHVCALDNQTRDALVYCWGENSNGKNPDGGRPSGGQCGADPLLFDDVGAARAIDNFSASDVQSGDEFSCALGDNFTVSCWGVNTDNELGNGGTADSFVPYPLALSSVATLGVIDQTACVSLKDGTVECWGYNVSGNTGVGTTDLVTKPTALSKKAETLGSGGTANTHCLIDVAGELWCFGDNTKGQTGTGLADEAVTTPTRARLVAVEKVSMGQNNACAMTHDGTLWCWGENDIGQLGQGTTSNTPSRVPVRVKVPCP